MMDKSNVSIKTKEFFSYYLFHPNAKELSDKEKCWVRFATIILGIFSLGIIHLSCYLAFKQRRVSLFDRYKDPNKTHERIQFLALRLQKNPSNQKTKDFTKNILSERFNQAETTQDSKNFESLRNDINYLQWALKEKTNVFEEVGGNIEKSLKQKSDEKIKAEVDLKFNNFVLDHKHEQINLLKRKIFNNVNFTYLDVYDILDRTEKFYSDDKNKQQTEINHLLDELLRIQSSDTIQFHVLLGVGNYYLENKKIDAARALIDKFPIIENLSQDTQDVYQEFLASVNSKPIES